MLDRRAYKKLSKRKKSCALLKIYVKKAKYTEIFGKF